jgi:hypothetical protein
VDKIKERKLLFFYKIAYADESTQLQMEDKSDTEGGTNTTPIINYEDLIAQARKEEKANSGAVIKQLQDQVSTLTASVNNHLLSIASKEAEIGRLNTLHEAKNTGSKLSNEVSLEKKLKELENELKNEKAKQAANVDELRTSIRSEIEAQYELKAYRIAKLSEAGDEVLTTELVIGNTKEEIDNSIKAQKAKTLEIKKRLGILDDDGNPVLQKRVKATPNNPSKDKGQKIVDLEYLSTLDPVSKEYSETRKKLGFH